LSGRIERPHASGPLRISTAPTQLVDLYPTVLEILGLESPYRPDGRSAYGMAPGVGRDASFGFDPADKQGPGHRRDPRRGPSRPAEIAPDRAPPGGRSGLLARRVEVVISRRS
jgi:hypothetical protein